MFINVYCNYAVYITVSLTVDADLEPIGAALQESVCSRS